MFGLFEYFVIHSIVVCAGLLLLAGFLVLRKKGSGEYACTAEALICPDGSGVGRSGPACAFTPCPGASSYAGVFGEQGGDFRLVVESPEGVGTGVAYVIPLEFTRESAPRELLGTRVEVAGAFSEGNHLSVETIKKLPGEEGDRTLGEVGVGESKLINGVKITLREVVADDRCPEDVVCISAGNVTLRVDLASDTDHEEDVEVVSDKGPYPFDAFQVSIARVSPERNTEEIFDLKDYRVQFRVADNPPPGS